MTAVIEAVNASNEALNLGVGTLWTPQGVQHATANVVGRNVITAGRVVNHVFHFHDKVTGRRSRVAIPADESYSKAQIEDMAANALESWLLEVRAKGAAKVPTPEQRKDVGRQIREFRFYAQKRLESTNNRIYYPVGEMPCLK